MMLWAEAVRRAGSVEPDKVIAALPGTRYDGPGGLYSIDEQANHTVMDIHIAIGNKDKGFDVVKSFPSVSPATRRRYATCAATPTTPGSTNPSSRSGCARAPFRPRGRCAENALASIYTNLYLIVFSISLMLLISLGLAVIFGMMKVINRPTANS